MSETMSVGRTILTVPQASIFSRKQHSEYPSYMYSVRPSLEWRIPLRTTRLSGASLTILL